jgi:selenocysteine lyase/cysteine desulfurase
MGDFGIGFLYAREELLERIRRPVVGYYQAPGLEAFHPPHVPAGETRLLAYALQKSAAGMFESGTLTGGPALNVALVTASLEYLARLGVANFRAHRLPLVRTLQREVPRLGFTPVTPPESTAGVVTFPRKDLAQTDVPSRLQAARINVRLSRHWMRLSPSIYNDQADVDRFLDALS